MSIANPVIDPQAGKRSSNTPTRDRYSPLLFWGGTALAVVLIPTFLLQAFWVKALFTPWYVAIGGTVAALAVLLATVRRWGWWRVGIACFCIVLAGMEWFFLLSLTMLPSYKGPVTVGSKVPSFQATLADGTPIDESFFQQGQDTALVFFQGRWCPFCMTQLAELEELHEEFTKAGAKVVVISIEDPDLIAQTQADFPHLTVVSDRKRSLSTAIDLINSGAAPDGSDTIAPTVCLLDAQGTVRWLHRPVRVITRPSASELVTQLESF